MKEMILGGVIALIVALIAGFILLWPTYHITVNAEVKAAEITNRRGGRISGPGEGTGTPLISPFGPTPQGPEHRQMPDFLSLLEKHRQGSEVRAAVQKLGRFEALPHEDGVELCFKDLGIHFVFDRSDLLDNVAFYADTPHPHQTFGRRFPLPIRLHFDQTRDDAGREIDNHAGRHIDAELGRGEWDKFEMQGYRLYLRFGSFYGKELIREIRLVRPELPGR